MKLHWQILIAVFVAAPVGWLVGQEGTVAGLPLVPLFDFIATLFLNALKMLIVPLIAASIINGVNSVGSSGALGRLGAKTLIYYFTTSLIAILIGLAMVDLVHPGVVNGQPARELIGLHADTASIEQQLAGRSAGDLTQVFLNMVPPNVVAAAANGQMLGLIFFSLLYGYFSGRINEPYATVQRNFWQGIFEVMMRITLLVLRFAPVGVFALVARVTAETGFGALVPLAWFSLTVLAALALHMFVVLPLILWLVAGVDPRRHFRAMAPALITAFSSASSSATLPLTLECIEKNAGVSNRTSSVVLPLGATINMDGTALYECVAALFIAQAYGVELSFVQQFAVVFVALLTSVGVAGIPAASLTAIAIILGSVGLPLEGIGLILAVDRILDMCRTTVNVFSDSCGAVVIGRLEGESGILADSPPGADSKRAVSGQQ